MRFLTARQHVDAVRVDARVVSHGGEAQRQR